MATNLANLATDKAGVAEIKSGAPVNKIVTAADLKNAASVPPGLSYPVYVDGHVHVGKGGSAVVSNVTVGSNMPNNTTGSNNSNTGASGLYLNNTGSNNSNTGASGLYLNTTGSNNSNTGASGLYLNTTGSNNSSLGYYAGFSGNYNNTTHIGANSQASADNEIKLGNAAVTAVRSSATFYGAGFVTTSDKRLKRNIATIDGEKAAEFSRLVEFVEYDRVAGDVEIGKLKRRKQEAPDAEEKRKADSKKVKAAKAGEAAQEDPGVVEPEFDVAAMFDEQIKQAEVNAEVVQRHEAGVIAQQVQDITKKLGTFEWLVSREYADDPESALQVDYQSMHIILQVGLQYRLAKAGF